MILPPVKDDETKGWNKIVIKENKVCISFEDIYAEFPFNVILASAFTISQANLKVSKRSKSKKKNSKHEK